MASRDRLQALDLEARVTYVELGENRLYILALRDISAENRRRVLERVFRTIHRLHGREDPPLVL